MKIEHDVPYLPDRESALLDIHYPASFDEGDLYSGIVVIHGGGWRGGDKADERQQQMATLMAEQDYVVINVNYTLAPKDVDRAPYIRPAFEECRAALQWFVNAAEQLKLDTKRIGTIGGSAGGHMALMLALTAKHPDFLSAGEHVVPISAVVNLYAPTTRPVDLEPVHYLSADCPPVLTLHGTDDQIVEVEQAHILDRRMQELNLQHEMHIVEGAPHTFMVNSEWGQFGELVQEFFNANLKNKS